LYIFGEALIFYRTNCGSTADAGKAANSTIRSSCVKNRLSVCNSFLNNSNTNFTSWAPIPTGMTLSVVDQNGLGYQLLPIENIFGMQIPRAVAVITSLNNNSTIITLLRKFDEIALDTRRKVSFSELGCEFVGQVSQSNITATLAASGTATTTAPTTSFPVAG
jgi:hypothetical protein